jgi:hypothetical protein
MVSMRQWSALTVSRALGAKMLATVRFPVPGLNWKVTSAGSNGRRNATYCTGSSKQVMLGVDRAGDRRCQAILA